MRIQLSLRSESGIGIYLKSNGFMPSEIRFNERGSNACKWIKNYSTPIRIAGDGICYKVL